MLLVVAAEAAEQVMVQTLLVMAEERRAATEEMQQEVRPQDLSAEVAVAVAAGTARHPPLEPQAVTALL
jgi:hypothetical protein